MIVAGMVSGLMISMASAATNQVYSKNAVGFVKVDVPSNALTIVAVPFNTMSESGVYTLDELIGTNLTGNGRISKADTVYIWTGNDGYNTAFLNDDSWGDPSIDDKWCYFPEGSDFPIACATTNIFDIMTSDGLWINNRHNARVLYFMGEVPFASTTTVDIANGLSMIANPYPVTKALDELITTNNGAYANGRISKADMVYLWAGDGGYNMAFLNDDSWGDPTIDNKWCYFPEGSDLPIACATTNIYDVEPGKGFWYNSRGGSFDWDSVKPYDWP
jgi:hypothetical protein